MNLHTPHVLQRRARTEVPRPRLLSVHLAHDTRSDGAPIYELSDGTERDVINETRAALALGLTDDDLREHVFARFDTGDDVELDLIGETIDWIASCDEVAA